MLGVYFLKYSDLCASFLKFKTIFIYLFFYLYVVTMNVTNFSRRVRSLPVWCHIYWAYFPVMIVWCHNIVFCRCYSAHSNNHCDINVHRGKVDGLIISYTLNGTSLCFQGMNQLWVTFSLLEFVSPAEYRTRHSRSFVWIWISFMWICPKLDAILDSWPWK